MQTLNGVYSPNTAASFGADVAVPRTAVGNWNFTTDGGATGAYTLFTVTGDVYIEGIIGTCKEAVTGGAGITMEVGIAGNAAALASLIAQTDATLIDQYYTWQDVGPEANPGPVILIVRSFNLANGADIILTIATGAATAGSIDFTCFWKPVSLNGSVVAA